MRKNQLTVFIGRFSPFHLGHEEVLLRALKSSEVVLLLIGSANKARNIKNPFTAQERRDMILNWYEDKSRLRGNRITPNFEIQFVEDHPYNDQTWIAEVQEAVNFTRKQYDIPKEWPNVLTGAQRDESTWYLNAFGGFFQTDFVSESKVGFEFSATMLRDDYFKGGHLWEYKTPEAVINFLDAYKRGEWFPKMVEEYEFVKKYRDAWKTAPYPPTFVCVDAVVIQSGHILLATRDAQPGKGTWCLPGGFVEQGEKLVDACVRELVEETSIELSPAQLYGSIVDKEIFDDPNRSLRGRTITTAYTFKLKDTTKLPKTKPQPGEGSATQWVPISEALSNPSKWYEDHKDIAETMILRSGHSIRG